MGWVGISRLHGETRPVDGAAIEARRRAGLEAAAAQAELLQRFAEKDGMAARRSVRRDTVARRSG